MSKQSIVIQEPSRYFLKDGKYHVEYKYKVNSNHHYLTDIKILWEAAFGTVNVNLSDDQKAATFCEVQDTKAVRYTQSDLDYIFHDLLVLGFPVPNKTPDKHKVVSY